jgi:peptidoglycan-associated lipoprotein
MTLSRRMNHEGDIMNKLLVSALFAALLAGCASTPSPESSAPVEDRNASASAGSGAGASTSPGTGSNIGGTATPGSGQGSSALRDPNNILSRRSIYFDYDSDQVQDQYRPLVEAHARYLQGNRSARMTIQGNTDERGSREYNIALAQRRADSAKRMMQLLGAGETQIETVSFGKEKPKNQGHDETAWAENRRDDIVYAGE